MSGENILILTILGIVVIVVIAWWPRGWRPFRKADPSSLPSSEEIADGNQSELPRSKHLKKQFEEVKRKLDRFDQEIKSRITIDRFNGELKKLHEEMQRLTMSLRDVQAVQKQILAVHVTAVPGSSPPQLEPTSPEASEGATRHKNQQEDMYPPILLVPDVIIPPDTPVRTLSPEPEPKPERTSQAAPQQRELGRSANELIVLNFDRIDGIARRQIERMKAEYHTILGNQLKDITDRNGAYIFEVNNSTLWVHPKPNAPLNRYWERAFPRAESYSLAIQHVDSVANVRFKNDEEYEVLSIGSFKVN